MDNSLLDAIRDHVPSGSRSVISPQASLAAVENTEKLLGFPIPPLLKSLYLEVGNGGFGPGYGVIGVEGGHASDLGTLWETWDQIKKGADYFDASSVASAPWQDGLLPFCGWGCNIFSCVDCTKPPYRMFVSEECVVYPQDYDLDEFFRMWIAGTAILDRGKTETETIEFINPFTRKKQTMTRRRWKK